MENQAVFFPVCSFNEDFFEKMKKRKRSNVKDRNFIVKFHKNEDIYFYADVVNMSRLQEFFDSNRKTMKMGIFKVEQEKVRDEHGRLMPQCKVSMPRFPLAKREKFRHAFELLADIRAGRRTDPNDAHLLRKVMSGNRFVLEKLFALESGSRSNSKK